MQDAEILALYFARDEEALERTQKEYGAYCQRIAENILHDPLDAQECVNDTWLRAWNTIPPSRPRVLKAFLTVIMRRIAVNRYHRVRRKSAVPSELTRALSELEPFLSDDGGMDAEFDASRLGRVISDFLRSLSERRRYIFIARYYVADPIDKIAYELGVSRSTVNKELAAIRSALKEALESEGFSV